MAATASISPTDTVDLLGDYVPWIKLQMQDEGYAEPALVPDWPALVGRALLRARDTSERWAAGLLGHGGMYVRERAETAADVIATGAFVGVHLDDTVRRAGRRLSAGF
jgi:hypothetical protein